MDVLQPELVWVQGMCYRFFESSVWKSSKDIGSYEEEFYEPIEEDVEDIHDTNVEIVPHADRYKHVFYVPKGLFAYIVGTKGAFRKRLEAETNTKIHVPKMGEDGDVVIIGVDRKGIISARHRIDLLLESSRRRMQATHFLSIPLNQEDIMASFNAFKFSVLDNYGTASRKIDKNFFQNPNRLHLTIGMFTLLDDTERAKAASALVDCKEQIIIPTLEKHGFITIHLEGVECMNDDPTEVKVLYAKISDNSVLQKLVNDIADYFIGIGLMKQEYNQVKLHATLMHTGFKDYDEEKSKNNSITFNATDIINSYKDTVFGETLLKEIHISQRHAGPPNTYYPATAKIRLDDI